MGYGDLFDAIAGVVSEVSDYQKKVVRGSPNGSGVKPRTSGRQGKRNNTDKKKEAESSEGVSLEWAEQEWARQREVTIEIPIPTKPNSLQTLLNLSQDDLVRSVVMSEVLGKPISKRRGR